MAWTRTRLGLCAAWLAGLSACAGMTEEVRVDPLVTNMVLKSAADQVRRCYRSPRVSSSARRIVTHLAVQLNSDGSLSALPVLVRQDGVTPETAPEAPRMAEAATLAVLRCAPLRLPAEHYSQIWDHFELSFSPNRRA